MYSNYKKVVTLKEYLIGKSKQASLNNVLMQISTSCKMISAQIRRAGLDNLYGSTTVTNFHGEEVKTLDVVSNQNFIRSLSRLDCVHSLISEEDFQTIKVHDQGLYTIAFDPLDGSSNIDANVNIGSIFAIWEKAETLQPGSKMVCGGYCLYGCSTMFVFALNGEVNGFSLDEGFGEFVLTHPNIRIPKNKEIYSVNEGNYSRWDPKLQEFINGLKVGDKPYSARYIGSMVADVHRTLLYGGLFMYPAANNDSNGKLRLLYEVAPMSFIVETAGGKSTDGTGRSALDIIPDSIHQRVPIFLGSSKCIDLVNDKLK